MSVTMTTQQAATCYRVSTKTIHRWLKSGKLKAEQVEGRWVIQSDGQDVPNDKPLAAQLDRADSEIQALRNQLSQCHEHIKSLTRSLDQSQQLLAVSQKSIQQLTQQNQFLLEDKTKPLWRRFWWRLS